MLPSNASDWEVTTPPPDKRGPRLGGGLLLTLGLLIVLIGVIAFAVTQMPTGPLARPAATTSTKPAAVATAQPAGPAAAAGTPADAATEQAIQDVIRKADEAQSRAIATKDPNVMTDTATPDFFAQQVTNNQDLVDNGAVDVTLVNIEWGPISVNGNVATATAYETWTVTFEDGSTAQSRDRNVYTLVKDSARGWLVQADDHPDQAQPGTIPTNYSSMTVWALNHAEGTVPAMVMDCRAACRGVQLTGGTATEDVAVGARV
jgi:ketosteroid isomerase-like protein